MNNEQIALRRVARAAKLYQEVLTEKRKLQAGARRDEPEATVEIGRAEFELAEALNEWYRTQLRKR